MKQRELKFREWLIEKQSMTAPYTLDQNCMISGPFDEIMMQFTGLLDKNGKEIYEGDVLYNGLSNKKVEWSDARGGWLLRSTRNQYDFWDLVKFMADSHSVLGNIYENPEFEVG